jgi:hypothetical protein
MKDFGLQQSCFDARHCDKQTRLHPWLRKLMPTPRVRSVAHRVRRRCQKMATTSRQRCKRKAAWQQKKHAGRQRRLMQLVQALGSVDGIA